MFSALLWEPHAVEKKTPPQLVPKVRQLMVNMDVLFPGGVGIQLSASPFHPIWPR